MNNKKRFLSIFILTLMVMTMGLTSHAEEVRHSHWAEKELIDAERLGIYDDAWYVDNFTGEIGPGDVEELMANIHKKLSGLDLDVNENFIGSKVEDPTTREGILKTLFNGIGKYDLTYDGKEDLVDRLLDQGVLRGDKEGLKLDLKASKEEAVIFAKRMLMDLYRGENQGSKGFMWQVENQGNKAYLLGSIHLADDTIYPFSKEIQDSYHESDELVVEVDVLEPIAIENMVKKMYFTDGKKLKDVLTGDVYGRLKALMDQYKVDESVYATLKPWAVSLQISNISMTEKDKASGSAAKHGIDMYFLLSAKVGQKPIRELEGMDFQIGMFNDLSMDKQVKLLKDSLDGINIQSKESMGLAEKALDEMLLLWKEGRDEEFKEVFLPKTEKPSDLNSILLGSRDEKMAEKIIDLLRGDGEKTYFIVVGAAHYISDGAVIDILRDKGFEVKRINR